MGTSVKHRGGSDMDMFAVDDEIDNAGDGYSSRYNPEPHSNDDFSHDGHNDAISNSGVETLTYALPGGFDGFSEGSSGGKSGAWTQQAQHSVLGGNGRWHTNSFAEQKASGSGSSSGWGHPTSNVGWGDLGISPSQRSSEIGEGIKSTSDTTSYSYPSSAPASATTVLPLVPEVNSIVAAPSEPEADNNFDLHASLRPTALAGISAASVRSPDSQIVALPSTRDAASDSDSDHYHAGEKRKRLLLVE